jgi:hypothetical protein
MFVDGDKNPELTMSVTDLIASQMPLKAKRTHETAHRPFSAAEYFTFVFYLIQRYIIGIWDNV